MKKLISLGELIDRTWEEYHDDFSGLMSISAWMLVTALVSIIALAFFPSVTKLKNMLLGASGLTTVESIGTVLVIVNKAVIAPVLGMWIFTSLVAYVSKSLKTKRKDVKTAMREGVRYFLPTLYTTILFSLLLLGAIMIGILPAVGLELLTDYFEVGALLITLKNIVIIAGIILSAFFFLRWIVHYSLSGYAVILDDVRGVQALKRSREIVQSRYWPVVLRLVGPKLLFFGVSAIALIIFGYVSDIMISAVSGLNLDIELRLSTILDAVFPILVSVFINPLILITDILLYRSLEKSPIDTSTTNKGGTNKKQ